MANTDNDRPTGAGPGITGASGDFIEGTGEGHGTGGTGHTDDRALAGAEPDERNQEPVRMDAPGTDRPDAPGPGAVHGAAGEMSDRHPANLPGGPRNVVPANDLVADERIHQDVGRVEYPRAGNPGSDDEH